jgi:hypothetical protein
VLFITLSLEGSGFKSCQRQFLNMSEIEFDYYFGISEYHADLANGLTPSTKLASTLVQAGELIASESQRGIKRDKLHYAELQDDKHFNTWKCGFVAATFMHHTQFVFDGDYVPVTWTEVGLFREMQIFMYDVFEEMLKTDKGRLLASA